MKDINKVSFVIIGTMIGAGFASGQEILLFFVKYGMVGLIGIFTSCVLTGVIIYQVLCMLNKNRITNYLEFLSNLTGNNLINKAIQIIVEFFLLISFYIMLAGFCAYFKQELGIPILVSSVIIAILCYFTFHKDIQGIISINTLLMPFLITFVLYMGIKNLHFTIQCFSVQSEVQLTNIVKCLASSILYASYNSILLIPMLIELKNYMNSKRKIKVTSILCSLVLLILGITLFFLLLRGGNYIFALELPMIQIMKEFGRIYPCIYGMVIITAIFTSAISAGYGFLSNKSHSKKQYKKLVVLLCISSVFIAHIGFSALVNILYPFFGILGLCQIFLICSKSKG